MRKVIVLLVLACSGAAFAELQKPPITVKLPIGSVEHPQVWPVTFHVPVQVRNFPSDIDNLVVNCRITAPSRRWEASSPVHLGAGTFIGTVTVQFQLPQALPYDAKYDCALMLGNSQADVLEAVRAVHADPAVMKVIVVNGSFN